MDTQQAITVAIRPCRSCGGGIPETDRFCRVCGENQQAGVTIAAGPESLEKFRVSSALVAQLSGQLVSGSAACVFSMTGESMTGERSASAEARKMRRIVSLLVSVPVWLIIVLLSPLDAYAAARLITDARWQQGRV